VLEDRQLESMLAEEEASKAQSEATLELEAALASHKRHVETLNQEKDKLEKDLKRLEEERRVAAGRSQPMIWPFMSSLRQKGAALPSLK